MRGKALKLAIVGGVVGAIVIALGAKTLVDTSTVPPSPKPYDVAMYDVYSDLLSQQEGPWLYRTLYQLLHPQPEAVLIRVETEPGYDAGEEMASLAEKQMPSRALDKVSIPLVPEKQFQQAVDSATADFLKRNKTILELQRKFHLPHHYDLFAKVEEQAFLKRDPSACQKYAGYERWVELSAVGFNQDQTVAVVHFIDWGGRPCNNTIVGAKGKYRMLQNRGGHWHLLASQIFADWILCE
jgi:hypothetical protein